MDNIGITKRAALSTLQAKSVRNLEFFKNENNKRIVSQLVIQKLRKIYVVDEKVTAIPFHLPSNIHSLLSQIDLIKMKKEAMKVESTLKNFKNLGFNSLH